MKSIRCTLNKYALVGAAVYCLVTAVAQAAGPEWIYNNATTDLSQTALVWDSTRNGLAVGNEVILSSTITNRVLSAFDFEYSAFHLGGGNLQGAISMTLNLWLNDGPLVSLGGNSFNQWASPSTLLASVTYNGLGLQNATARSTLYFSVAQGDFASGIVLPSSNMTWTVSFSGLVENDVIGLDLYGPPSVGGNFNDFWMNAGAGWGVYQDTGGLTNSIGARIEAVPEPSTFWLLASAGLIGLGFSRRFLRKK